MITWEQFFEAREQGKGHDALERQEELLGKDLDGDGEKGESKAHKKKVLGEKKKPKECKTCNKAKKSKKA